MSFFKSLCKDKIVISIGDNGAAILSIVNNVILHKYFFEEMNDANFCDIKSLIVSNRDLPVYFLLNYSHQIYTRQTIPAASRFIIRYLINMKSYDTLHDYEVKSAFLISKPSKEDNNWHYMFVECKIQDKLSQSLIDIILEYSNNFKGILLFPIELVNVTNNLLKIHNKSCRRWTMLIAYTKTNDFRQIVLDNGKIVFTNVIAVSADELLPDIIAGQIYQEIENTIRYLAEFGLQDKDEVSLYVIIPSDIKASLLAFDFQKIDIYIFTPYELAKVLMIRESANIVSVYCDTVMLYAISQHNPLYIVHTKKTHLFYRSSLMCKYIIPSCMWMSVLLCMLNALCIFNINVNLKRKVQLFQHKEKLASKFNSMRSDCDFIKINEMRETVDMYKLLSSTSFFSLDNIMQFHKLKSSYFSINYLSWGVTKDKEINMKVSLKFKLRKDFLTHYEALKVIAYNMFDNYKVNISIYNEHTDNKYVNINFIK
ncbi:hypothetical protein HL033_01305 [Neoehrlichia mikurensis]|uniref:Uncharacterized protein n=1 Tax=Neoehrlichia mikurensis TaxID=89586 RepID=A0A9Q9BS18_9RICK|nr:hypothetical protein [Neoehrlichia mikurensis]QXK92192.1 hypothetical protein IAH97_01300 [Neoehrlichia mikurensis]QXK92648.1 hypothetical protein HUN61_01300 [Neoehrlichia mikurensis]QXK93885.1 hypothetical protein HL033_01305 [Neoehrlichia mikurensis]UTO55117.1 hypothetical protein LUA82_02810 [Neoehrlichia mikurensis]UTO56037.1 hypothetical protein LUA81_02790 [Neoehrlichia mikurensis]